MIEVMAHGQANAEVVSDGSPSLTCNHEAPIAFVQNQREEVREQEVAGALSAEPGTHQTTYVAFDPAQVTSKANRSNPQPGDPCHTLHSHEPPMLVRMREGKDGGGKGPLVSEDQSLTLATANDQVLAIRTANTNANGHGVADGITHTLDQAQGQAVMTGMQVRRLTPIETARLQGFPDTYCHIPTAKWRKIPTDEAAYLQSHGLHAELRGEQWYTNIAADGPIYKANGNSWAVPCARWIGERIKAIRS